MMVDPRTLSSHKPERKLQVCGNNGRGIWLICQLRGHQPIGRPNLQRTTFKLAFYNAKQSKMHRHSSSNSTVEIENNFM
jgi:hypothetical protein